MPVARFRAPLLARGGGRGFLPIGTALSSSEDSSSISWAVARPVGTYGQLAIEATGSGAARERRDLSAILSGLCLSARGRTDKGPCWGHPVCPASVCPAAGQTESAAKTL